MFVLNDSTLTWFGTNEDIHPLFLGPNSFRLNQNQCKLFGCIVLPGAFFVCLFSLHRPMGNADRLPVEEVSKEENVLIKRGQDTD